MERPVTIESDRLGLVALVRGEIEAPIAGETERAGMQAGVSFPLGCDRTR